MKIVTAPMMNGLEASPRICEVRIWSDWAVERRCGIITYNRMSTTTDQLVDKKVTAKKMANQEMVGDWFAKAILNTVHGIEMATPIAQTHESAAGNLERK